ncbi:hypothetical protein [Pinirhizobacter soli]|uniref:hypothetical protein n=1 Tax=Pinirhizobacter soli TaxID=2786953 RepID=UPI00202AB22D|nr:hypothetical protein [Pinirhizobacter soli]
MNENPNPRIRQDILFGLKLGAVMIGAALLFTLARKQGWIDAEQVLRWNSVVMGLALAAYANAIPKMYGPPPRTLHHATLAQAVRRVTSWALTLAFLVWAALWAFAPRGIAQIGSVAAVGTGVAVMFGYLVWKATRSASGR